MLMTKMRDFHKVANATKYVDVGTANAKQSFALACGLKNAASGVTFGIRI